MSVGFVSATAEELDRAWREPARRPVAGDAVGAAGGPHDPERMARDDVCPNLWAFDPAGQREWLQAAYEALVAFVTGAAERGQGAFMGFA
ncbi:hypothetical protein [Streptomyces nigra]